MFNSTDIVYYLSGGTYNKDLTKSLGGAPSQTAITNSLDNLFQQVSLEQISSGSTTYRCFYLFNEGSSTLQNTSVWLTSSNTTANISIGVGFATEIQQIVITGNVVGGSFTLRYTANVGGVPVSQDTSPITFTPHLSVMASNIQNALNALTLLGQVTVSASRDNAWVYNVTFGGIHANRYHLAMIAPSNNLIGFGSININISIVTLGNPINATAADIGFSNQEPNGVDFISNSSYNPIVVGTIEPLDGFAVWLLRTTSENISVAENTVDSIVFNLSAQAS